MAKNCTEFVIQPNAVHHQRSWWWPFALLVVICIGIALRFAWLGYWMILPFAIIDVVAVGLILRMVFKKSNYTEKVLIDREELRIEHIETNHDRHWQFPLHWAQMRLNPPAHRWYPHRLLLGCKGEWVEIGQCLTNDERESLAKAIGEEMNRLRQPAFLNHA